MKFQTDGRCIRDGIAQVLDVFNNIVIKRRDRQGNVVKTIPVPCVYANRSRVMKSLENKSGIYKLPIISLTLGGMNRDTDRITNVNHGTRFQTDSGPYDPNQNPPIPMTSDFELTILTQYQEDMDSIVSNFIVFFNPDIWIATKHPRIPGKKIKNPLIWDGSLSYEYPTEVGESDDDLIKCTANFSYKFWIWAGENYESPKGKYIHHINDVNITDTIEEVIVSDDESTPNIDEEVTETKTVRRSAGMYAVPTNTSFRDYKDSIENNLIHLPYYDEYLNIGSED